MTVDLTYASKESTALDDSAAVDDSAAADDSAVDDSAVIENSAGVDDSAAAVVDCLGAEGGDRTAEPPKTEEKVENNQTIVFNFNKIKTEICKNEHI